MNSITHIEVSGYRIHADTSCLPTKDFNKFEIEHNVSPGKRYTIKDPWNAWENYIYLGYGWSACYIGHKALFITASENPHYTTSRNESIPDSAIQAMIMLVNSKHEVNDGYETDV